MNTPTEVWTHPLLEVRRSPISGDGLFVIEPIAEGEYIDTFAVGDDIHIVLPPNTVAHFGNHGCDPSIWPVGTYELATRRAIAVGEELTVDYGLISDDPTFRMDCSCRAVTCRQVITGEDWRRRELQERYAGHWPPGLQHRIDAG